MNRLKDHNTDLSSRPQPAALTANTLRSGQTSPVIVVLLTLILVAIVGLILAILFSSPKKDTDPSSTKSKSQAVKVDAKSAVVKDGETVKRDELPAPPVAPAKPVADPNQIKQNLHAGATYRAVIKEAFQSRVEDSDWGLRSVINITYAGEYEILRKIESNDGKRIVELRTFANGRAVKVLSEVEQTTIDLGTPGMLFLVSLESYLPGTIETVATSKPILEALFHAGAKAYAKAEDAKVVAAVDSLTGKQMRIVYVDGVGVESVTPVGCSLTESERDFAFASAILSDCYIFPKLDKKEGESWPVDGAAFGFLFDPSWKGQPTGEITIVREKNQDLNGQPHAFLKVGHGLITLNATNQSRKRLATFTPTGRMSFALKDSYIDSAHMQGKVTIEEMSQDHLLFPTVFKATPIITIDYSCQIQP